MTSLPPLDHSATPADTLEQIRPRLLQLTQSLTKLEHHLQNPKVDPTTLQNQYNVALQQLSSVTKTINQHQSILETTVVYPNREFNTLSPLLFTLLRKKLTPEVEAWIADAQRQSDSPPNTATSTEAIAEPSLHAFDNFVSDLIDHANESIDHYLFGGYLTKEEVESGINVKDVLPESIEDVKPMDESKILGFIYQGLDSKTV